MFIVPTVWAFLLVCSLVSAHSSYSAGTQESLPVQVSGLNNTNTLTDEASTFGLSMFGGTFPLITNDIDIDAKALTHRGSNATDTDTDQTIQSEMILAKFDTLTLLSVIKPESAITLMYYSLAILFVTLLLGGSLGFAKCFYERIDKAGGTKSLSRKDDSKTSYKYKYMYHIKWCFIILALVIINILSLYLLKVVGTGKSFVT